MATITMDASEYEALKKNISLLEEAKKKEAELSDEIKQLQQEKIQALKDAQHSVTIIKKSVRNELLYKRRSDEDILKYLQHYFTNREYYRYRDSDELDRIINMCFEKGESRNIVDDETITTRGFDEVKEEIRQDYLKDLSQQTKSDLESFKTLQLEHSNIIQKNTKIEDENYKLLGDVHTYRERAFNYEQAFTGLRTEIKKIIQSKWNVFNYLDNLQKLKQKLWIYGTEE